MARASFPLALAAASILCGTSRASEPSRDCRPDQLRPAAVLAALYDLPLEVACDASASLDTLAVLAREAPQRIRRETTSAAWRAATAFTRAVEEEVDAVVGRPRRLSSRKGIHVEASEPQHKTLAHTQTEQSRPAWPELLPLPVLLDASVSSRIWFVITVSVIFVLVVCIGNCRCLFRMEGEISAGDLVNIDLPGDIGADGILSMRERRWLFLTEPEVMGNYATCFAIVMTSTIQVSLVSMTLASFKNLTDSYPGAFELLEWGLVFLFTGEWMAKLLCCPNLVSHITLVMTWIDLAAIVPSFIDVLKTEKSGGGLQTLKLARLLRCFRLFRLAKLLGKSETIETIVLGLQEAVPSFAIAVVMISIAVFVPSVMMFYVEQGDWDPSHNCFRRTDSNGKRELGCSPFQNIIGSLYWGFTTVTTVGYGDVLPITGFGRFCACVAMVAGILALSLPIGMISNAFTDAMVKVRREHELIKHEAAELREQAAEAGKRSSATVINGIGALQDCSERTPLTAPSSGDRAAHTRDAGM